MGTARQIGDSITQASLARDYDTLETIYGVDAVLVDPAGVEVRGSEIVEWYRGFREAFPDDFSWEPIATHETDFTAIDEGCDQLEFLNQLGLAPATSAA